MPATHELLTLDDAAIYAMSSNPQFLKEFQFLRAASSVDRRKSSCGRCNKKAKSRIATMNSIKLAIRGLSGPKKTKLKQLLNTKQIRMRISQNGKIVVVTM